MGQLKYHNGTTWVPVEGTTADYSAFIQNDPVAGTIDGSNKVFTTTRNFSSVTVYVNGVRMFPGVGNDYTVTGANQITFTTAPKSNSVITADFSTSTNFTANGTNSFILKQAVSGSINGSNTTFTTASGYIGGTLQVFVNGLRQAIGHVTESNPGSGTFVLDTAYESGTNIEVSYMMAGIPSGNADTVDSIHASQTPTANTILPLDANSRIPAYILKQNTARYYALQGANMGTTSASYVNFTPVVSITTTGGALEMELFCTAYVSANTGFFALLVNGVDYEVMSISGSSERGFWGKIKTPALPAGTYTVQMRGKCNGGASINVPAFNHQTIFVKEVDAG